MALEWKADIWTRVRRTHWIRVVLGILAGIALLLLLFRGVDIERVGHEVMMLPRSGLLGALFIIYLSIPLRVIQWKLLLHPASQVGILPLVRAVCLGHLANVILPLRGGELLKAAILAREAVIPLEHVLLSAVLCRLQDVLPVLLFLGLALGCVHSNLQGLELQVLYGGLPVRELEAATLVLILVLAVALAAGALFLRLHQGFHSRMPLVGGFLPARLSTWLGTRWGRFAEALSIVQYPGRFWGAQLMSFLCWAIFAMAPLPLLIAFAPDFGTACLAALVLNGLTTLVQLAPVTPTGIGTYHLASMAALGLSLPELPSETALALTFVLHLLGTAGPAFTGIPFLAVGIRQYR